MRILLKNIKKIYTPETKLNGYKHIIIKDKLIDSILKELPDEKAQFDKIIDCSQMVVLPGLINNHTHSSMSLLRGYADDLNLQKWLKDKIWPAEAKLTGEDIYWGAMLSVIEMIKNGITTFTDMYFQMDEVAEVVKRTGIRAMLSEGLIEENDGIEGLNDALGFALRWQDRAKGRIKTCLGPHSAYTCSKEYLKMIRDKAVSNNLIINIHISETEDEQKILKDKYGLTTVKLLNELDIFKADVIAAHCVHVTDKDLDILKEKDVNVVYNPKSNMKLSSGIAPISKMIEKNINVSYGTDGAASNNNLDLIEEARVGSYLQKVSTKDPTVLPINESLKMITVNGAKALGYENLGEIKEGYLADLILVNKKNIVYQYPSYNYLSNIFYAGTGNDVNTVIVNGKIIMEDKKILRINEEKVYKKVEKLTQKYR